MGGSRFLPLVAVAACADLSGLNGLEVTDGAATEDATADAGADTNADATNDSPLQPDANTTTFCQSQTTPYVWCADFDEGDVTYGYLNGKKAQWTGWSQTSLPTLSTTHYASPPASAHFDPFKGQETLTFSASVSATQSYEMIAELRVDGATDQANDIATVQITTGYGLKIQTARTGGGYAVIINEVYISGNSDGGLQTLPHQLAPVLNIGDWVSFDVTVTNDKVNATVGSSAPLGFNRAVTGGGSSIATTLTFAQWTGEWDSVRISM